MRIVLAGGSGFLGRALHTRLRRDGHEVRNLTRRPRPGVQDDIAWTPDGSAGEWARTLDSAGAIVNLAGEGIADRRWSEARKHAIRQSRLLATESLVAAVRGLSQPPAALVNASAVGYYGAHGAEVVTEHTPPGSDFLADLCVAWERTADAASAVLRVAFLRSGLVLDPKGGALAKMMLPFRLGVGGRLGPGTQYMPWIHRDDWIEMVVRLIGDASARGPFNLSAPVPVTNADFTRALANALHRPAIVPVPGFALRLALGELAESLLTGQRAIPSRAEEMGFRFHFREIDRALDDLIR